MLPSPGGAEAREPSTYRDYEYPYVLQWVQQSDLPTRFSRRPRRVFNHSAPSWLPCCLSVVPPGKSEKESVENMEPPGDIDKEWVTPPPLHTQAPVPNTPEPRARIKYGRETFAFASCRPPYHPLSRGPRRKQTPFSPLPLPTLVSCKASRPRPLACLNTTPRPDLDLALLLYEYCT
jgi:hypothetical protein